MRTSKTLLLGLSVLADGLFGAQGEHYAVVTTSEGAEKVINLEEFTNWSGNDWRVGERYELGRNHGIGGGSAKRRLDRKHVHLPAYLNTVQTLDLSWNNLTSFVVPPGMVQLHRIRLAGNTSLTNLVIQQDTGVCREERVQRLPEASVNKSCASVLLIEFEDVGLKSISAPEWLNGRICYDGTTFKRLLEIEHEWRPSGAEVVRWRHWFEDRWFERVYVCWGPGVLQSSIGFPIAFYDEYPWRVETEESAWNRRTKLATPIAGSFGHTESGLLKIFRVRKNTGKYVDVKVYPWPSNEPQIVSRWRGDTYEKPRPSPISTVTID